MDLIILAGGFGTRLRQVVADVPKPMAPVGERPFLAFVLDALVPQGITRIILSVYHQSEVIESYFGQSYLGVPVNYVKEPEPLGTGGAIKYVMQTLQLKAHQPALVVNGDTSLELNVSEFLAMHQKQQRLISMALALVMDTSRYGAVLVRGGCVSAMCEKGQEGEGLINAGAYLIEPALWQHIITPKAFSFEQAVLTEHLAKLLPAAFIAQGQFIDIGIPKDYACFVEQTLAH